MIQWSAETEKVGIVPEFFAVGKTYTSFLVKKSRVGGMMRTPNG
jgi:hypothetical protein